MSPTFERTTATAGSARDTVTGTSFMVGMVLFVLGILALIFADVVTVASVVVFGVILVASGIAELTDVRPRRRGGDRYFLSLLSGLLSLAVGFAMLIRPGVGVTGSGLLVAGWLLATGLFRGVAALVDRYRYWGWDLFYGALSVVLGLLLVSSLPTSALWLLGTLVAIELMARGVAVMGASLALGRLQRASATAA
jgi:uncharacterized membrane protein HdeD (DUF308 family)